ncbi:S-layer homology domain-containing protein, partial [Candidatus Gracilibacteria bacterium]|nr:S-layer homology domain-containing protein [Candidatus Gracilibacteria bacterium]
EGVKVMEKLSGRTIPTSCTSSSFSDVATSDWVCKYTEDALAAGFIAANPTFRPDGTLTKIEGLKKVMQARSIAKSANTDWKMAYVEGAVAAGIATSFSDYNTPVDRGTFFVWAAEALAPSDDDDLLSGLLDGLVDVDVDDTPVVDTPVVDTPVVSSGDMLTVSLNPETPSNGLAQHSTARIPLLVFDVKAGSQDVTLNEATFEFIGLGDYADLDDVSIYNSIGEKVSKTKSFSEITREISFDRDIVVEAGSTMTLTVAGMLNTGGSDNATYGIKLVDIQASSNVEGEDLVGALLVPATFSNTPSIEISEDKASGDVVIGENQKLAGFDIEEKNDNGDVIINTITIHLAGSVDEDDVTDLALSIEGTEVASNLMVNGDDEIVALVNYTLASDDKVTVELTGTIVGSVGDSIDFVFEGADDIYTTAANTGMPVAVSNDITTEDIASLNTIEGAEINISFDKSDVDEANPDSEDVLIGTLMITASSDDYEITKLEVAVTGSAAGIAIDDLELGGSSYDSVTGNVYTFEDIVLSAGEEIALALTMDLNEETDPATLNGNDLVFNVTVKEIEDDTNDVTYVDGAGTNPTSDILSTTALSTQSIDIESAGITFTAVQVNERELVLGNGIQTVIYKGKISVSDSETVTIQDLNFDAAATNSLSGEDLDDVIDSATLNIGGQTFDADVESDSVDFTNINAVIAAGADNIEVLVTAVLKDNDSITGAGNVLALQVETGTMELEDSNGDDLVAANITTTNINTATKLAETKLLDRGTFLVKVVTNGELEDDIEETVLAGSSAVALAEVEIQAEFEAIDVDALTFTVAGDFSDSLLNVNLVAADGTVIASNAVVNLNGGNTEILFEDFTVAESDDEIDAVLVADLRAYDTTGDETQGQLGDIIVMVSAPASADLEGDASNDPITTITTVAGPGDTVSVVPALVTASIVDTLGTDDKYTTLEFTVDKGDNDFDNDDVVITAVEIETAVAPTGVTVRNSDSDTIATAQTTTTLTIANANGDAEITSGDTFEFKVEDDDSELRIVPNGISYSLDGATYTTNNDTVMNLGEYNESN